MTEENKIQKRIRRFLGVVVSDKMDKTAVVKVERLMAHKRYGKRFRKTVKFKIHDPKNECKAGDKVAFAECRPLSKDKRWRLISKIK